MYQFLFFLSQNSFGGRDFNKLCGKLIFTRRGVWFRSYEVFSFRAFWVAKK